MTLKIPQMFYFMKMSTQKLTCSVWEKPVFTQIFILLTVHCDVSAHSNKENNHLDQTSYSVIPLHCKYFSHNFYDFKLWKFPSRTQIVLLTIDCNVLLKVVVWLNYEEFVKRFTTICYSWGWNFNLGPIWAYYC